MYRHLVILLLGLALGVNAGSATLSAQEKKPAKKTAKYLAAIKEPPTYVRNENYDKKWFQTVKTGIDKTRDYLGNYGPVQVYVIGQQKDELADPQAGQAVIEAFCRRRSGGSKQRVSDCLKRWKQIERWH